MNYVKIKLKSYKNKQIKYLDYKIKVDMYYLLRCLYR